MARIQRGTAPQDGVPIASCEYQGARWTLYLRVDKGSGSWLSLKLTASHHARKANFWLGWSMAERRYARTRDAGTLERYEPMMLRWARCVLDPTVPEDERIADPVPLDLLIAT